MCVYISGQITGIKDYKQKFDEAEKMLKRLGYEVINPASHFVEGFSWRDYMIRDIKWLMDCDLIYRLEGWEQSKGARLENQIAEDLGIKVLEIKELSRKWE